MTPIVTKLKTIIKKLSLQRIVGVATVLIVVIVGVHALTTSHAQSPYASTLADSGTITTPAASQPCSGSTNGNCVVFGTSAPGVVTPASYFTSSVTNQQVTSWSVDANSSAAVSTLISGMLYGQVGINENRPIFQIPAGQAEVPIDVTNDCGWDFSINSSASNNYTSAEAPIPSYAYPSTSSDLEMALYQPSSGQEWDFWDASDSSGTWTVGDGGQLSITSNPPSFTTPCGSSASGISEVATTITEQDIEKGSISHALSMEIPYNLCNGYVWPATRGDCSQAGESLAEGQYFRFPSSVNCSTYTDTPIEPMICNAIKNYGLVIMDRNSGGLDLEGEDTRDWANQGHTGTDPLTTSLSSAGQWAALPSLPWSQLQLVDPPQQ
jgi:hypothetical protein